MDADGAGSVALALGAALLVGCGGPADVTPVPIESVGAPDYFGRGIVRIGDPGDRVLVHVAVPAFWAMVRFDANGDVMAAAAAETRRDPGMIWLAVPSGRQAVSRPVALVSNPACAESTSRARRDCAVQPRVVMTGAHPLRTGESLILFVSTEPIRPALIEDRLNLVPAGSGITRVPAFVMADRRDIWAAYLVRK